MRLALLATAATLIALPALADPPQQPPLQQKLQTLNQAIGDMTNRVTNALGGVQTNLGADVTHIQQATNDVLQEMTRQAADQKKTDDAALADAHKDADARVAATKKGADAELTELQRRVNELQKRVDDQKKALDTQYTSTHGALLEMVKQRDALQKRVDDQARQLLHVAPPEPSMCINGPMSPKQLRELLHSEPAPGHK